MANYGPSSLKGKKLTWTLGEVSGTETIADDKEGLQRIAAVSVPLGFVTKATRLTFTMAIDGTEWKNSWNIWVYPQAQPAVKGDVVVTQDVSDALAALNQGKDVLFSPRADHVKGLEGKFVPVFWSPVHFPNQAGTMGVLCDPTHPALAQFPTDSHSDWQWWQLVKNAKVLKIDSLHVTPLIKCVDNFANNRRLALAFEAKCGKGRLVMTSMDLLNKSEAHPEVRQMLVSLLHYMNSDAFKPQHVLQPSELQRMLDKKAGLINSSAESIY